MSSVPAVIDALLAGLRARPALAGVLVSDGMPSESLAGRRILAVGGQAAPTAEGSQAWAALGTSRRSEDYALRCYAVSVVGGTDQKAARDNAYGLVREVGVFLRADPSLAAWLPSPLIGEGAEMGTAFALTQHHPDLRDDDGNPVGGRWAEVAFDVRVRTRI